MENKIAMSYREYLEKKKGEIKQAILNEINNMEPNELLGIRMLAAMTGISVKVTRSILNQLSDELKQYNIHIVKEKKSKRPRTYLLKL